MKHEVRLNTGATIPILGFGTWKLAGDVARHAVQNALEVGYRHIDTADRYGNHKEVAEAIDASGLQREELFITSKVWMTDFRRDDVYKAAQQYLQELKTDYIDLLLMHWPDRSIPFAETLQAMQDLKERDMVKAIGVSNFTIHHLEDVMKTGIQISMNQIELHPSFYQKELHDYCTAHDIAVTAWSPLGQGKEMEFPIIVELAEKYNKSPAQIILNWIMGKGIVAIPKATKVENMQDNLKALDWELEEEDVARIDAANQNNRLFSPAFADFDY